MISTKLTIVFLLLHDSIDAIRDQQSRFCEERNGPAGCCITFLDKIIECIQQIAKVSCHSYCVVSQSLTCSLTQPLRTDVKVGGKEYTEYIEGTAAPFVFNKYVLCLRKPEAVRKTIPELLQPSQPCPNQWHKCIQTISCAQDIVRI